MNSDGLNWAQLLNVVSLSIYAFLTKNFKLAFQQLCRRFLVTGNARVLLDNGSIHYNCVSIHSYFVTYMLLLGMVIFYKVLCYISNYRNISVGVYSIKLFITFNRSFLLFLMEYFGNKTKFTSRKWFSNFLYKWFIMHDTSTFSKMYQFGNLLCSMRLEFQKLFSRNLPIHFRWRTDINKKFVQRIKSFFLSTICLFLLIKEQIGYL